MDFGSTTQVNGGSPLRMGSYAQAQRRKTQEMSRPLEAAAKVELSPMARILSKATAQYEASDEVREAVVTQARQQIEDWNGLSDEQLDRIVGDLLG